MLYRLFISGDEQLIVLTSAKDNSFKLVELLMSLTYMKNNRGPNIDPCVTPHLMFSLRDFILNNSIIVSFQIDSWQTIKTL